jgi:hypothetical protein
LITFLRILRVALLVVGVVGIGAGIRVVRERGPGYDPDRAALFIGICLFLILGGILITAYLQDRQKRQKKQNDLKLGNDT